MSNKVKEKKQYKIWQLTVLVIIAAPFVLFLLSFIVFLSPILLIAYIFKMYFDVRLEKHEITEKYKLKNSPNYFKLILEKEKLRL